MTFRIRARKDVNEKQIMFQREQSANLQNDEIKTQSTRYRRIIEFDENLLTEISELKRQRLIIDLKFTNLDIYHNKNFKKFKD